MPLQAHKLSRRQILTSTIAGAAGALLAGGARTRRAEANAGGASLVWVWQFSRDGTPDAIGRKLLDHGLGMILKTHDGPRWMSEFDDSPYAVSGTAQVNVLTNYYEEAGIPFHAWAVLKGIDPLAEAGLAADVLGSGVRSLYLNLEATEGGWQGSVEDAHVFAEELRRRQPEADIRLLIDPRPWMRAELPMKEMARISNSITMRQLWRSYNTGDDAGGFAESGYPPAREGITPRFLVAASEALLPDYDLPVHHAGDGTTTDQWEFRAFTEAVREGNKGVISGWRFGEMSDEILAALRDAAVVDVPSVGAQARSAAASSGRHHTVVAGETLWSISIAYDVSVDDLIDANDMANPEMLSIGQELVIP